MAQNDTPHQHGLPHGRGPGRTSTRGSLSNGTPHQDMDVPVNCTSVHPLRRQAPSETEPYLFFHCCMPVSEETYNKCLLCKQTRERMHLLFIYSLTRTLGVSSAPGYGVSGGDTTGNKTRPLPSASSQSKGEADVQRNTNSVQHNKGLH